MNFFFDHIYHDVVTNEPALIHYFLRFSAEGSLLRDLRS